MYRCPMIKRVDVDFLNLLIVTTGRLWLLYYVLNIDGQDDETRSVTSVLQCFLFIQGYKPCEFLTVIQDDGAGQTAYVIAPREEGLLFLILPDSQEE